MTRTKIRFEIVLYLKHITPDNKNSLLQPMYRIGKVRSYKNMVNELHYVFNSNVAEI